jgi:hypothetical protein
MGSPEESRELQPTAQGPITMKTKLCLIAVLWIANAALAESQFYKTPPLFSTAPATDKSQQSIDRFGPLGIGIELHQPPFVMKVGNVEPGSPADGKLKKGQIIETINGQKLQDIDPRIQLGNIITAAEATDGLVTFRLKDAGEVVVKIPVLGAYSPTWPLNCPKSDKIVRDFAAYLKKPGANKGFAGVGMLFLLGTGDDTDLDTVRQWVHGLAGKPAPTYAWHLGYGGIPLCEYYLRTGDPVALPVIQKWVDNAVAEEFLGGWSQKGHAGAVTYGGGGGLHNAAGTAVLTFLLLAKECGATMPDETLQRVLTQFFRFAGRGVNPYGDNRPESGLVDNGRNGNLAFAMAAAAALTPDGENSIYAGARDVSALYSFHSTTFMLHGHTGGGIGEIWRSAAMGLLHAKLPKQYRDFMDSRRWHYELSRRFDGSFGILGGARYDTVEWGTGFALAYIVPRQTLRITGAPPTKFSKQYKLPERPWGTAADDGFESVPLADVAGETLVNDPGRPFLERMTKTVVDDATLRRYARHPSFFVRTTAARKVMGVDTMYLGGVSGKGEIRVALAKELMKSGDARVRRGIYQALYERLDGEELLAFLGTEGFTEVIERLRDPAESWWVKEALLQVVARCPTDAIVPHVDFLTGFLKHPEWWLQAGALSALTPVATEERCYRKVIPPMAELVRTSQRWNTSGALRYGPLPEKLREAPVAVQQFAAEEFRQAYAGYTGVKTAAGGLDISRVYDSHREFIAKTIANLEGGYDLLYQTARQQFPNDPLPLESVFLDADFDKFGPELRKVIKPVIRDHLIYEYMAKNRAKLLAAAAATEQNQFIEKSSALDGLVDLYQKMDVTDYDWHAFGPDLKNAKWDYWMFDPPEKQAYDISPWRYRKVTLPAGMETWFMPDFDPVKAGWKQGLAPFGQFDGKLVTEMEEVSKIRNLGRYPMRTFWDKEVLLVRGTFEFPALKPGHLYRLGVNWGNNVGGGDGYRIYINGKQLIEVKEGVGRRAGGRERGAFITKEFLDQFGKGPVTIAAITFLRYGSRAVVTMPPVPQGCFSLEMDEMKLPPLDAATFQKAATVMPMRSAEWQAQQDPDDAERSTEEGRFKYDGKFVANAAVLGDWTTVAVVPAMEDFTPTKRADFKGAPFKQISFKDGGTTDSSAFIWSGNTLMDLNRYQALQMTVRGDYLFIEAGGFSEKNPVGWKSPLIVLKRKDK